MASANIILVVATLLCGLVAGLFFAWSFSVMPGLKNVDDSVFISSMQAMNRSIQNPLFFTAFFGAMLLLPVAAYVNYGPFKSPVFLILLSACILYLFGVIAVTVFCNVPLNNMLDAFKIQQATGEDLQYIRQRFERPWNNYNSIRTVSSLLSFALAVLACLIKR